MKIVYFLYILYYTYVTADIRVKILHSGDVWLRFDEVSESVDERNQKLKEKGKWLGSFPRLVTKLKHRGGILRRTLWFKVHSWKICADRSNALQPDGEALGYYVFIEGMDELKDYVNSSKAPVLVTNLDLSGIPELKAKIKPYIILGKKGVRIDVIGYTSQATTLLIGELKKRISLEDEVKSIREYAIRLNNRGVKIIIDFCNSGLEKDQFVVVNFSGVKVVVGGKDRIFLRNRRSSSIEYPLEGYREIFIDWGSINVPVLQAYAFSKYLGCLNLTFDKNSGFSSRRVQRLLEYPGEPDLGEAKLLDRFRRNAKEEEHCGETKVILEGTNNVCGHKECNFGNLVADAFVEYDVVRNSGPFWTNTPIGLVYAGAMARTIAATTDEQKIRKKDLHDALPIGLGVARFSVTGSVLRSAFETAVMRDFTSRMGEFLQVSGIQVQYDLKRKRGSRVVSLKARCGECEVPKFETVEKSVVYNIVGPNRLITPDSFFIEMRDKHFNAKVYPAMDIEIVAEYMKRHSPISTGERDGIVIVSEESHRSGGHSAHLGHIILNNVITILITVDKTIMN